MAALRDAASRDDAGGTNERLDAPTDFERLAALALSRRGFLRGGAAFGTAAFVLGAGGKVVQSALAGTARAEAAGLDFTPVAANGLDTVTVPAGFAWHVVARWGDPLWSDGAPFDHATRGTGASQERAFGDNNDGMALFADADRSVLAVNNEYTNLEIMPSPAAPRRRAGDWGRRAQVQGGARRLRRRGRPGRRFLGDRPGFALQPAHHARHADGDHRALRAATTC